MSRSDDRQNGRVFRARDFFLLALVTVLIAWSHGTTSFGAEEPDSNQASFSLQRFWATSGIDFQPIVEEKNQADLEKNQIETLLKIWYRLDRFPLEEISRLAHSPEEFSKAMADPKKYAGDFFQLQGTVDSVTPIELPENLSERFKKRFVYQVSLIVEEKAEDGTSQTVPCVLYSATVPKAWVGKKKLNEPAGAEAVFLMVDRKKSDEPIPVLAAARVGWYPANSFLGRLGFDVGLLETIRDQRPVDRAEREAFYQLLAAVGRAQPGALIEIAKKRLQDQEKQTDTVEPLFNRPADVRGRPVLLRGTVRRAVRVRVDDPDIVKRFGIDHYYELYLFTPDSQGNPLVVCVRELPEGMPTGDGPNYRETIEVAAIFLKSWRYRSRGEATEAFSVETESRPKARLAPLLIGREPVWIPTVSATSGSSAIGIVAAILVVGGIGLLWFWLARASKADEAIRRRRRSKPEGPIDDILENR